MNQPQELFPVDSLPLESQICAQVLQHLATGTTPTHLLPSTPLNATQDAATYRANSNDEHHHLLTVALSILLDSTSPGPDPLALKALGWAYGGGGGGGGMGDWDGCHYMPGSIGATLRVLQDQVALGFTRIPTVATDAAAAAAERMKTYLENQPWWLQDHEIEYGKGRERRATRFCTVGGIPPWVRPYNPEGLFWGPPLAGVCVPSSCTAAGLYVLFDERVGFADKLLELASQDGFFDESVPGIGPPTASRRFRYMSSLAQSFVAGMTSQMGIVCEGESGLRELDEEGYVSVGCCVTLGILMVCLICVCVGTWWRRRRLQGHHADESRDVNVAVVSQKGQEDEERGRCPTPSHHHFERCDRCRFDQADVVQEQSSALPSSSPLSLITQSSLQNGYGSTNHSTCEMEPIVSKTSQYGTEEEYTVQVEADERQSSECREIQAQHEKSKLICHTIHCVHNFFACFDASLSFHEITRVKREKTRPDPMDGKKSMNTLTIGDSGLDPYDSHPSLASVYSEIMLPNKISSKQTFSISSSKCLNGMRSLSMLWIIFGHTMAVQSSIGYQNPAAVLPPTGMMSSMLGTLFLSARYAVDTFFFIGGYLVMSGLLKRLDPKIIVMPTVEEEEEVARWSMSLSKWKLIQSHHVVLGDYGNRMRQIHPIRQQQPKGLSWMVPFLLHRILRILPTYFVVLMLWWKVAVVLGDGPFWPRWATFVAQCDAQWWTNMLFVNNLVPLNQPFGETSECMYHAWYLGVDFQLCAVLTPIFLSLFLRKGWRRITIGAEMLYVCIVIAISMKFSYKYKWSAHLFDGAETMSFDRGFYINPFFRSTPFVIGFITAQIWHEKCRLWPNFGFTKAVSVILSFSSIALLLFLTLGTGGSDRRPCLIWESPESTECGSGWSREKLAIYNSFVRPTWGLGLAVLSLLSFNGQLIGLGSSTILNWDGWCPIGKLSFSMYLLHPLIINIWVLGRDSKFRYSHVNFFYAFAGIVSLTFLAALVLGILVEWPISKITKSIEKKLWSRKTGDSVDSRLNAMPAKYRKIHS